jgi:hypothetical protein
MRAAEAIGNSTDSRRRLREEATEPELLAWVEDNPDRARRLSSDEVNEVLDLQAAGGSATVSDIDQLVERIERRRALVQRVTALAGSQYLDLLEQFVALLFEKVQPHSERR